VRGQPLPAPATGSDWGAVSSLPGRRRLPSVPDWDPGSGRLLLVAGRLTQTNAGLLEAFARTGMPGHWVRPVDLRRVAGDGDVVLGRLDVTPALDGVEPGLDELGWCQRAGLPVLNPPGALIAAHDKWATAERLAEHGVPHPRTEHVADGRAPRSQPPVVLKPRFGGRGSQVELCETGQQLRRCLRRCLRRRPWFADHGVLVQELVPSPGRDLRLVVAGRRVVGAAQRVAPPGEWRTNLDLGARRHRVTPPTDAVATALAAAAASGGDLVGVDLLPLPRGGWTVLELNGAVDFTPEYARAGEDIFAAVAAALTPAARRQASVERAAASPLHGTRDGPPPGGAQGHRRGLAALLTAAVLPVLAGCGAGFDAASLQWPEGKHGTSGQAGDVLIRNAVLVANGSPGADTASFVAAFVNTGAEPETLVSVTGGGDTAGEIEGRSIEIPADGVAGATWAGRPAVTLRQLGDDGLPGKVVPVTLFFERSGAVTLELPVRAPTGVYATLTPRPTPTS
jgi:RimK family alpha-L-glutamate ligase